MRKNSGLFVGAVVLLTFGCGDPEQPPNTISVADSADQTMFGVEATVTHDGVMQAMIEADTAYQYESLQLTEFKGLTVHFYDAVGTRTSTLTSVEGTFHWGTEDMEARGNVIAVTPDGRRLATEILVYDKVRNEISGSQPFVYEAPPERHLEGDAFTSDTDFQNVRATRPRGPLGNVDLDQ